MKSKYIFADVDGTLVNFEGKMPDSTADAINAANANGHKIIVCTGRARKQVYPFLRNSKAIDGMITSSGSVLEKHGKVFSRECFPDAAKNFIVSLLRKRGIAYAMLSEDGSVSEQYCVNGIAEVFRKSGMAPEKAREIFGDMIIKDRPEESTDAEKIVYYDADISNEEMAALIGPEFNIDEYSFGRYRKTSGEITLSNINKATAIEKYIRYCGADLSDVIAVGDGDNDRKMIKYAPIGIAMGNSSPSVLAAADYVTDDINNDGFAKALIHFGLI